MVEPKFNLFELASAYCFGLSKAHAFYDGNKRVAYITVAVFLELNGLIFSADHSEIVRTTHKVADSFLNQIELAVWFRMN